MERKDYLCPTCGNPFDPSKGLGPFGRCYKKPDGTTINEELGVRMTCGVHWWELPGKKMADVIADFPVLAPEYIRMTLADRVLGKTGC